MPDSPHYTRPQPWVRYAIAGISIVVAILARAALRPILGEPLALLTFLIAICVAAWVGVILGGRLMLQQTTAELAERKRTEAALQDAQRFLERVAHTSPAILLVYDIEKQRNVYANRDIGEELGYPPGTADGAGPDFLAKVFHPDDLATAAAGTERFLALADGEVITSTYRMRHASGTWHWRSVRLTVFSRHPDGRPRELLGVSQDITDQKRAEEGLREADRRKDEFLATLAHELRNPLAPIRTGLKIMQMAGDNQAAVEQARAMMERQLRQMVRLIDDLLDVSRITRGKLELRKGRADLCEVIQSAVEASRPPIEAAGVELTVAVPTDPVYVDADVTRLAQVFTNLLNNAAKFTERGGHVWLTADRQGSDVAVTIRDTGIGIPPDMLSKVFDLFAQVDRSLERSRGGLGIGLTLARRLVALHGGTVEARSAGPGQGTSFTVRLPLFLTEEEKRRMGDGEASANGVSASPPLPFSASDSRRLRVLVADDNQDAADSLQMMLGILGHEVRAAHDGREAVRAAEEFRPDVAFLDIGMPGLNGYDVARTVRARPWGRDVRLIALTGWGQEEDHRRSREAGFDQHLVKPVDPEVLQQTLARRA
jgi:two-component system CheB/CheR fusion protein